MVTRSNGRKGESKAASTDEPPQISPLQPSGPTVQYHKVLSPRQQAAVQIMGWLHIAIVATLAVYLLLPDHLPRMSHGPIGDTMTIAGLVVLVGLQLIVGLRTLTIAFHAARVRDPFPMKAQPGLRVAVLTTIVPNKEPVEMVMATLRAMLKIRHDGPLDVWLLDEGNDPYVALRCEEIGVHYFTRKGVPEWNTETGPYRAKTKHGNHNSWRSVHEYDYDVVAQMDPDHVPWPNFLERTLAYFSDPDTAFVVAPQVYGNLGESFVARGAAQLAYLFHGIIQRGANGNTAPLLIGTNHLYRPSAFDQIGGYQDCIIEDHLTSMVLYSAVNKATGNSWKGVYTPDVIAVGEGPATYADWFTQQKRWAFGIWEIARQHSPELFSKMKHRRQRMSFVALQLHYPTAALMWVGGVFLSSLHLVGGITVTRLSVGIWGVLFGLNIVLGPSATAG
jgi:cellulose synthase/poly-beta-1,6-N-acetylglucosamine synthase-like glycosyltransferase